MIETYQISNVPPPLTFFCASSLYKILGRGGCALILSIHLSLKLLFIFGSGFTLILSKTGWKMCGPNM